MNSRKSLPMKRNQFSLPSSIASPEELVRATLEVKEYAKWFNQESIRRRVSKKKGPPAPMISDAAKSVMTAWADGGPQDSREMATLLKTLEDFRRHTETVTITLAAPVTGQLKQTLVSWCRTHISPSVFVSFQFNATLLGGAVIRYGSRVFDWSFRRQLLDNAHSFAEVLRRV